jgi:TDG/mug DNA glycosylase family protein
MNQERVWEDILAPDLKLVFVGFNPSIPAWRTGHYYANPSNRFYHLLFESGLTPKLLSPKEDRTLLTYGIGATDLVAAPSARADLVPAADFREGAKIALTKLIEFAPKVVCCNGVGVYRYIFGKAPARLGRQPDEKIGQSVLFVVPSSSGLANRQTKERREAYQELAAFLKP